jgi:NAD(P)-dependent dehydrogenase (short-subunit alcohol dehydrogenase family)
MTTPQAPIDSPFGYRSSALEVTHGLDLAGKTAFVTGGYSGLGTEIVRALAAAGARVLVGARRPDKAAADLADVAGAVEILALDLADPAAIDACAAAVASRTDALHILINNAAIMACPLARDARGYESQFATNHLGHFQLTARLWPLLEAAKDARVVSVSSIGHRLNGLSVDDPSFEHRPYDKWLAYGQAKSANALFALHLDALGAGRGVRAFAVHPGGIATPLQRHLTMDEQKAMGWYDEAGTLNPMFKTPAEGAATAVWCATSPLLEGRGGVYCEDCNIAAMAGDPPPRASGVWPHIRDAALAAALWERSEAMTGVPFSPLTGARPKNR